MNAKCTFLVEHLYPLLSCWARALRVPLLVDRRVLAKERINFGSGHHLYGVEIDSRDLGRLVEYRLVDIAEVQ